jgi:bacterioferritin-associated ferredoxin
MTEQAIPDVSDPDIRQMVLRGHEPEELWSAEGSLVSVHCGKCFASWPCPSIQAAREATP